MAILTLIPFVAALFGLGLAGTSVARRPRSLAAWTFAAGMVALGLDSLFTGLSLRSLDAEAGVRWLAWSLTATGLAPLPLLYFSLTYARGRHSPIRRGQWAALALGGGLPAVLALLLAARDPLVGLVASPEPGTSLTLRFSDAGSGLNVVLLVAFVLILVNLEQTLRASVGTIRWRIKFVVLGLTVIIGTQIYARSQALLFVAPSLALAEVESSALLIGCLFLVLAHVRTGFDEIDVYPSTAVLRSSFTILLVGGYLFVVGVLAQLVQQLGGPESFQFQALIVLVGMAGLTVLLLSDRLRHRIRTLVARHFGRARHDSTWIWTQFSERLSDVKDLPGLGLVAARSISEIFEVLSVTVWLLDERNEHLARSASTARTPDHDAPAVHDRPSRAVVAGLHVRTEPFDLDTADGPGSEEFRRLNPVAFATGGRRWVVPLRAEARCLGAIVLADRVNHAKYTPEELELLKCIGAQVSATLMGLRLANEVALTRELDAFRTMSAFFVHDLKNAATALNMTLRNLPAHFDDPAFRDDALRVVENSARRIDGMIARLGALRERPDFRPVSADLNQMVREACERAGEMPGVELITALQPLPAIRADVDQLRSVLVNLLLNARDALGQHGRIEVRTASGGEHVEVSVADNGSGMTREFIRESLFRPFKSTKTKGLGIGLYQSHTVIRMHGGSIQVESEPGTGTTFRVSLPVAGRPDPEGTRHTS